MKFMVKALFWVFVAGVFMAFFPKQAMMIGGAFIALVLIIFGGTLSVMWYCDRKKEAEEQAKAEEQRRELAAATERKRIEDQAKAEEQAQIAVKREKIRAEKQEKEKRAAEEAARARTERITKYNRLAKEAAADGDLADAECWRRLAVEEQTKTF